MITCTIYEIDYLTVNKQVTSTSHCRDELCRDIFAELSSDMFQSAKMREAAACDFSNKQ